MADEKVVAVAAWMFEQTGVGAKILYQEEVAYGIAKHFGRDFIYENENESDASA